jgi:cell division protein FtsW
MPKTLPKPDYLLLGITFTLIAAGLLVLYSASVAVSYDRFGTSTKYIQDQLVVAFAGIIAMLVCIRIPYRYFVRISLVLLLITVGLLVLVYVPGIGVKLGGARRWLSVGTRLFQPSEFAKLALILYLASFFSRRRELSRSFLHFVMPPAVVCSVIFLLVALQPDIGTLVVFLLTATAMFFAAGIRLRHFLILISSGVALVTGFIASASYRVNRILAFLQPTIDPKGISYQLQQALLAIGSGGILGYGYGYSRQKYQYLPEVIGDSIFAVAAEELGFIRIVLWLLLFAAFAWRGFAIAKRAPDTAGMLVVIGITVWIVGQALVNIGAISGLLPLTGIPLPFTSFGGSALLSMSCAIGILLNVSRYRV